MSLLFSLLMRMDAGQAKAELRALQQALSKSKTETAAMAREALGADAALTGMGGAAGAAVPVVDAVARAHTKAGQAMQVMEGQSRAVQGQLGNLTANFNDLIVMTAAGQNPIQLALQQGLQITQVLGPMGAAGAVRGLGAAFMSLLNPVNLVTLGVIAFGGMAIQWLTASEKQALSFEDGLQQLEDRTKAFTETTRKMGASQEELRKEFGLTSEAARQLLADISEIELRQAMRAADDMVGSIGRDLKLDLTPGPKFANGPELQLGRLFEFDLLEIEALKALKTIVNGFREVEAAVTLDDKIAATRALAENFARAAQASGDVSRAEDDVLQKINEQLVAFLRLQAARQEAARAEFTRDYVEPAAKAVSGFIDRGVEIAESLQLLATLESEANIRALINEYGRDSATVAAARLEAERAVFEEMVAGLDVSDALKDRLMEAWAAANGLASARIAAMIEQALGPASKLAGLLQTAAAWWGQIRAGVALQKMETASLAGQYAQYGAGRVAGERLVREESALYAGDGNPLTKGVAGVPKLGTGAGTGKGGGGAARDERDAIAELIAKMREEQEVLRELDPVKREMLKHRKTMAEATAAERAEVEELIRTEIQLKAAQQAREYASNAVGDFLEQIIVKGAKASDVLRNLAAQFLAMAARSFITGQGWFAQALGIGGPLFGASQALADGGLVGSEDGAVAAAVPGLPMRDLRRLTDRARTPEIGRTPARGLVLGKGGPRADAMLIRASAGEFMVNARATARWRPFLERINAGSEPAADTVLPAATALETTRPAGPAGTGLSDIARPPAPPRASDVRGLVLGKGGPRADAMLIRASAGEFMVNARATAQWRPVLERINAGADVPGFAAGGMIGAGTATGAPGAGASLTAGGPPVFNIHLHGATGNAEITQLVQDGVRGQLEAYDRRVLPARLAHLSRNPRERG